MEIDYHRSFVEAMKPVQIENSGFSWFGRPYGRLPARVERHLSMEAVRKYECVALTQRLYRDFYTLGYARPSRDDESESPLAMGVTPFVGRLIDANAGAGCRAVGWDLVETAPDGGVVMRQDGLNVWFQAAEHIAVGARQPGVGAQVEITMPKHRLASSPGYYLALGNETLDPHAYEPLIRLYWSIEASEAPSLVRLVTTRLNGAAIAFQLKVLSDPSKYDRCDSGVLYVRRKDFGAVSEHLAELWSTDRVTRVASIPALTKPVGPGIGLAEDPGNGESFGTHRCRLIAEGLLQAHDQGAASLDQKFVAVAAAFADAGLRIDEPFLGPGGTDRYGTTSWHAASTSRSTSRAQSASAYLEQAITIAHLIVRNAVWQADRCTWVGAAAGGAMASSERGVTYRALGPDLYNGTSGIALFLGELAAVTGERDLALSAKAAIRHALMFSVSPAETGYWGLFTGWPGVALASSRVGMVLNSNEILELSHQYIRHARAAVLPQDEVDLVSGLAGGLTALLAISNQFPLHGLEGLTVDMGDALLATSEPSWVGHSWRTLPEADMNLTGMAHGASGIGFALIELYRRTDQQRFRIAAQRAFDYERQWYDADAGNWRDFRRYPGQDKRRRSPKRFSAFWCHGAPGIALSRLGATCSLRDTNCRRDVTAALQTTRRTIRDCLTSGSENFSLCHGLAGYAEVLNHAGTSEIGDHEIDAALVRDLADHGLERYSDGDVPWPGGCAGETPGLMLGLAGIGHFYLRMHTAQVPSPTLVSHDTWR